MKLDAGSFGFPAALDEVGVLRLGLQFLDLRRIRQLVGSVRFFHVLVQLFDRGGIVGDRGLITLDLQLGGLDVQFDAGGIVREQRIILLHSITLGDEDLGDLFLRVGIDLFSLLCFYDAGIPVPVDIADAGQVRDGLYIDGSAFAAGLLAVFKLTVTRVCGSGRKQDQNDGKNGFSDS